ncbi:zinc finger protein [Anopheles sinensis]|uniref:Zinc finger protein n=1 Tax=Anopheles sinensis TaxID=74873 RepID=A0A084WJ55_ANOSI|nr:zinc finger protein [Anopheles sinensis]
MGPSLQDRPVTSHRPVFGKRRKAHPHHITTLSTQISSPSIVDRQIDRRKDGGRSSTVARTMPKRNAAVANLWLLLVALLIIDTYFSWISSSTLQDNAISR